MKPRVSTNKRLNSGDYGVITVVFMNLAKETGRTKFSHAELIRALPKELQHVSSYVVAKLAVTAGLEIIGGDEKPQLATHRCLRRVAKAVEELARFMEYKFQDQSLADDLRAIVANGANRMNLSTEDAASE